MFGILQAVQVPQEGVYSSYEELFEILNEKMEKDGYKIVKERSHRARLGGAIPGNDIIRCDLVCHRGGRPYKSSATKHKTSTKKTDCPWKAKAVNRKSAGGWILSIVCDQHNHEPGTPEPPTPPEANEAEETPGGNDGPHLDQDTATALQVAGLSEASLRLTGDTFNQFKSEYRKMSQTDRLQLLSHFQLRIAAIYAVQNEDMQRQRRQEALHKRHMEVDSSRRQSGGTPRSNKRRRANDSSEDQTAAQLRQQLRSDEQALGQSPMSGEAFSITQQDANASLPMANMFLPQFQQYAAPKRARDPGPQTPLQNTAHN